MAAIVLCVVDSLNEFLTFSFTDRAYGVLLSFHDFVLFVPSFVHRSFRALICIFHTSSPLSFLLCPDFSRESRRVYNICCNSHLMPKKKKTKIKVMNQKSCLSIFFW